MADPQREVDAMVRAIRAGLMSREMAVASLG
jgi:capsid protein